MKSWAWTGLLLFILSVMPEVTMGAEGTAGVRITVVYNNVPHAPGLTTAWGFAALIESGSDTVLFDTGGDGATLLANMSRLNIAPERVGSMVLSHIHGDHTGGLDQVLARHNDVTVYMPQDFPPAFRRAVEQRGARVETVSGPRRLFANLHTTGEMGDGVREQALIIDIPAGLVLVTGCAHPDIVDIARAARVYLGKDIYLLMGGFHLRGRSTDENRATVDALRKLGVRKVAPSHCTGEEAIAMFREAWGEDFLEGGCGAVIDLK